MKILVVTPYFYPHKGGSQQYAMELHTALMKQSKDVEVDVLCYNTDKAAEFEEYKGLKIYRIPCFQILKGQFALPNYFALLKTLNKLFRKNRYDFINSHTRFFENSWWVPFVAKYYNTTSVLTDHCADHPTHKNSTVTAVSNLIDRFFVPIFIKLYDHVTVTNKATQEFHKKLTSKPTDLIYGGVDTKYFKSLKKSSNRKILSIKKTFTKNDIVVSFVGRMIYSKGPQVLVSSAKILTKKHRNVYFIFGGDGELYRSLKKNESSKIFFTGSLEKREIKELLSRTDILVHPSMHNEGFPNVLLEAGASACAVIATDAGGTKEIITSKTGVIAKPTVKSLTSNIETLIKDKRKRESYAKSLRSWVEENYDWKKIAQDYNSFIKKKINKPSLFPSLRMTAIPRH